MQIELVATEPQRVEAALLGLAVQQPRAELTGLAQRLDSALGGRIGAAAGSGELRPDEGQALLLQPAGALGAARLAVVSLGADPDLDALRSAAAVAGRAASAFGGTIAWAVDDSLPFSAADQVRALVEGTVLAGYDPGSRKTGERRRREIDRLVICGDTGLQAVADRTEMISAWVNHARALVDAPPNELTPAALADAAGELAQAAGVSIDVLEPDRIESLGLGALAAVARGSAAPARLIVLRHTPAGPAPKGLTLGLVGKAVTFDSGGHFLKQPSGMITMKTDMAGGAAVLAGFGAIAELAVPLEVVAVIPATENMLGGDAFRPGDVIRAANGKTIEITNTDAEGRLILADALWYARELGATHVADFATLTGAMSAAMGDMWAGVFANDDAWRDQILAAAEASGDHAWPWPLHRRYRRLVETPYADLKNSSGKRTGLPIVAAYFLQQFAGSGPWAHLDIASTAFLEEDRGDYLGKGATGWGVRLIVALAERLAGEPA